MWFYLSDCIKNNLRASKTQIFVEEHAHTAPRQRFKQLPPKTQNPRQNPFLSKHTTDFPLATFLEKKETSYIWRQASWVSCVRKEAPHCLNERLTATAEFGSRVTSGHDNNKLFMPQVQSDTVSHSLSKGVKNGTAFHQRSGPWDHLLFSELNLGLIW